MTTILAVVLGLLGIVQLLGALAQWKLRRIAREWHAALRGEPVNWLKLPAESGIFVAEIIALEKARVARLAEEKRKALVHLFHPHTPFQWFCGARTTGGHGSMGFASDQQVTCEACRARFPAYEVLTGMRSLFGSRA